MTEISLGTATPHQESPIYPHAGSNIVGWVGQFLEILGVFEVKIH